MGDPVQLQVVKSEKAERDRLWTKKELLRWIQEEVPDDVGAFAALIIRRNSDGSVSSWQKITGNEVVDIYCAQYMAGTKLPQLNLAKENGGI
jgi:hypothetical protein